MIKAARTSDSLKDPQDEETNNLGEKNKFPILKGILSLRRLYLRRYQTVQYKGKKTYK